MKTVLHIGCGGHHLRGSKGFDHENWREIRLDINPAVAPDIVSSITDLSGVANASMDAVYTSHCLEHIYPHEVPTALARIHYALKADGFAVITVPDIQETAAAIVAGNLTEPLYHSPAGPIAPLDIIYGWRPALERGEVYMAHKTAFTETTLKQACKDAGFQSVISLRYAPCNLSVVATILPRSNDDLETLLARHVGGQK